MADSSSSLPGTSLTGAFPSGKLIFMVNPTAGKPSGQKRLRALLAAIEERTEPGRSLQVVTEAPKHATALAEELSRSYGPEATLFVCGGDGTVHEAVNGLMAAGKAAIPFAVIPTGTGNDYARHLYGRKDFAEILDEMAAGRLRISPVDVVLAHGRYCSNIMSFGLDTRVQMINERLAEKAPFLGEIGRASCRERV